MTNVSAGTQIVAAGSSRQCAVAGSVATAKLGHASRSVPARQSGLRAASEREVSIPARRLRMASPLREHKRTPTIRLCLALR